MKSGFVEGETYYVKMKNNDVILGDLIFTDYSDTQLWFSSNRGLWFHDINGRYIYLFELNEINIYRYVTEEHSEKYDQSSIILKRLLDIFVW